MSKIAVVYWSGTGNTEAMAGAVAEGVTGAGGEAALLTAAEFDPSLVDSFDAIAFGCPSMGSEELEESEFAPMFEGCEPKLKGKKIALFGSYGWGDGEWMRTWEENRQYVLSLPNDNVKEITERAIRSWQSQVIIAHKNQGGVETCQTDL